MRVTVTSISSGSKESFRGTAEQVLSQLLARYPWAKRPRTPGQSYDPGSLRDVVGRLAGSQDLLAEMVDG
jgi:hypothetical protein